MPGDRQADPRASIRGVFTVLPLGIFHDRPASDLVEGDRLAAMPGGGRHRQQPSDKTRVFDTPLKHLHPTHRSADDRIETVQVEMVDQEALGAHHIPD